MHEVQESKAACQITEKGVDGEGGQKLCYALLWASRLGENAVQEAMRTYPKHNIGDLFRQLLSTRL